MIDNPTSTAQGVVSLYALYHMKYGQIVKSIPTDGDAQEPPNDIGFEQT